VTPPALRRSIGAALLGTLCAAAWSTPAAADPPAPTDYRSEVVAIDPPTPSIAVDILGGDSFVQLTASPGTEVIVVGYQGEDYLWIRSDGQVLENRRSPSTFVNRDRYGNAADGAPVVDADQPPEWRPIGSGGRAVWHDHRTHWMQRTRPPGLAPGDQILEADVPLRVDGREVTVTVTSVWLPEPSRLPAAVGVALGIVATIGAWAARRRPTVGPTLVTSIAVVASIAGVWQFTSLPGDTGPRLVWWALPVVAVVFGISGLLARRSAFWRAGCTIVAGAELALWGLWKRNGLSAALVPGDAPDWFDRFSVTLAISGGVGLAVVAAATLWRDEPQPQRVQGADGLTAAAPPVSTS
jgi:hypothetical protein